jgi:hypothetical protein
VKLNHSNCFTALSLTQRNKIAFGQAGVRRFARIPLRKGEVVPRRRKII